MRALIPALVIAVVLTAIPAFAGFEVRDLDPLSEKDLSMFKIEGGGSWKLDDTTDAVHTFIVCEKTTAPTSLLFRSRKFTDGFQVKWEMKGGSKQKGLKFEIVTEKGERIVVPWSARLLMKKDWRKVMIRVEDGKAYAKIGDEEQEKVDVPDNKPLTFAFTLGKRQEATFRKMRVKFLVINREQVAPEEGFVRIFDGKTLEGWVQRPEGATNFKAKDQRIEGSFPRDAEGEAHLIFGDAQFTDYTLRMRVASGARGLNLFGRYAQQQGQRHVVADISGYFPGDKDWNDVIWEVKGKSVSLTVNGSRVWSQQAASITPIAVHMVLTRGGQCVLRDIRVKASGNTRVGKSWARYVKESGGKFEGSAEAPEGDPAGGAAGAGASTGGGRTFEMFNGKDLTDWRGSPSGAFRVAGDRIVGTTYDLGKPAELIFSKYVFEEYRISFSIQKTSVNAAMIVKGFAPNSGNKTVALPFEKEWFGEEKYTEFEASVIDGVFSLFAGGKKVKTMNVAKAGGIFGFVVGKEGAIGVKDIWFNKKK